MAGEEKQKKDSWDKIQVLFTILTALATGVWGAIIHVNQKENNAIQQSIDKGQQDISNRLAALDRTIKSVDSMAPYVDRVVDPSPQKAKLAAYALYILNKDDPQMAVSLILAADKRELYDVLKDIGKRDPQILKLLSNSLPKESETDGGSKAASTKSVEDIVLAIHTATTGYCYLGNFDNGRWSRKQIEIPDNVFAEEGKKYTISDDVYLRDHEPTGADNTLGNVVRINKTGDTIKIKKIVKIPGKDWVWADVEVTQ